MIVIKKSAAADWLAKASSSQLSCWGPQTLVLWQGLGTVLIYHGSMVGV